MQVGERLLPAEEDRRRARGCPTSSGMSNGGNVPGPGGRLVREELAVHVAGDADREDVDHRAADDLVRPEADRDDGVQQRQQAAARDRRGQRAPPGSRRPRPAVATPASLSSTNSEQVRRVRDHRAGQHLPLDADVDDPGALAHHAAERRQRDRGGEAHRLGQQSDQALRVAPAADDRSKAQEARPPAAAAISAAAAHRAAGPRRRGPLTAQPPPPGCPLRSRPRPPSAAADPAHQRRRGHEQQHQPLDQRDDVLRHAGVQLHQIGPVAHRAEQERADAGCRTGCCAASSAMAMLSKP